MCINKCSISIFFRVQNSKNTIRKLKNYSIPWKWHWGIVKVESVYLRQVFRGYLAGQRGPSEGVPELGGEQCRRWELDDLLTEKESRTYWRNYRDDNIFQNNLKKQLINDTKEMVQFSHPDWNEDKLEDEIEKRIQLKLDEGELLEVLTVLELNEKK